MAERHVDTDDLPSSSYGIVDVDLSKTRDSEETFELIRAPQARSISVLAVEDECYLRFGGKLAPRIDMRDFEGSVFNRPPFVDEPFGSIFVENPSGTTGTLRLFLGGDIASTPEVTVDTIQSINNINDTITVDDVTGWNAGEILTRTPNESNLAYGEQTVTTSGTAEALNGGTSQAVPDGHAVTVKALASNNDTVYVGDSSVATGTGFPLVSGESVSLAVDDVASIYADVDTNGEGVRWIVEVA